MNKQEFDDRFTKITDGLFVSEVCCRSYDYLRAYNIDSIVSILTKEQEHGIGQKYDVVPGIRHKTFDYNDGATITPEGIDEILACFGTNTLLHCISGANRSSAIAICYLISKGNHPVRAFGIYSRTRGMALAKVYKRTYQIAHGLEDSIIEWMKYKDFKF
jgi:hypothetical protein